MPRQNRQSDHNTPVNRLSNHSFRLRLIVFHIRKQLFPSFLMLHIIERTHFAAAVIMPQNIIRRQMIFLCQPRKRMYQGIVCFLRKLPVLIQITALDGNRIRIPRRNRVCLFLQRNTLDQLALVADDKMRACRPLLGLGKTGKITAVLCR